MIAASRTDLKNVDSLDMSRFSGIVDQPYTNNSNLTGFDYIVIAGIAGILFGSLIAIFGFLSMYKPSAVYNPYLHYKQGLFPIITIYFNYKLYPWLAGFRHDIVDIRLYNSLGTEITIKNQKSQPIQLVANYTDKEPT